MADTVHQNPDAGFDLARQTLRAPHQSDATLANACDTLSASSDWQDVILVRETRNALWMQRNARAARREDGIPALDAEFPQTAAATVAHPGIFLTASAALLSMSLACALSALTVGGVFLAVRIGAAVMRGAL